MFNLTNELEERLASRKRCREHALETKDYELSDSCNEEILALRVCLAALYAEINKEEYVSLFFKSGGTK